MNLPIFILMQRNLGWNLVRSIFATLDMVSFQLFSWVTQAVFDLATLELISDEVFQTFQERIYVVLGIFMLFKITISLLSYLVNPDKINDKEQGIGKVVSRTAVSLCLLVAAPGFFNLLYRVQEPLLNAVPRIILGKSTNVTETANQGDKIAETISWTTYGIVFPIDQAEGFNTVAGAAEHINDPTSTDNSEYKYKYLPFVGMLIGLVMTFLMVGICIDVAIRVFKLAILRMIAPIPILSYIDPKSSKDGMFQNYVKTLTSTWLDLFIKVGILFFVLSMIDLLIISKGPALNFGDLTGVRAIIVAIFIIIGLLFFARQFPNFITSALGIKNSKGLGVGIGGMVAAGGALIGGAGLAGMIKASGDYMNEAADAAAQGKAAGPSWSKGRDVAAQLRTGDAQAKGRTLAQRGADQLLRLNARAHGFTDDAYDRNGELRRDRYGNERKGTITQAKEAMYHAKDAASNATVLRNKIMEGHVLNNEEITYLATTFHDDIVKMAGKGDLSTTNVANWNTNDWNAFVNTQNTNAAKAEKYYQKAEKYAASRGVRTERPLGDDLGLRRGSFDPNRHNR